MLIRPAIDDTDPIRYRRPTPDGQFFGNIIDEAMRAKLGRRLGVKSHAHSWRLSAANTASHKPALIGAIAG
jgi:hypothetical protein